MKANAKGWGGAALSVLIAALLAVTAFALLSDADAVDNENTVIGAPGDYNAGDIAAINDIIINNGLAWTACPYTDGDLSSDPTWMADEWDGVTWTLISAEQRITGLNISSKSLTGTLDVTDLTALEIMSCGYNNLIGLDVSSNTALTSLWCQSNKLTVLDVSNNTALEIMDCGGNSLTVLDVSNNTALRNLYCNNNGLTVLDVSNNTALTLLDCLNNSLTVLDVSNNTALKIMDCGYNSLTVLDVSNNTALTELYCDGNYLTVLDVSNNTALEDLRCSYNDLTGLNISGCVALTSLTCRFNSLTVLDVTSNTALEGLYCDSNSLTGLDVTGLVNLNSLDVRYNKISATGDVTGAESLPNFPVLGWDNGFFHFSPQKDITPPTVTNVTPSGTGATISGNVVITFSEVMDTTPGTVQLNTTALAAGSWSAGYTVYTAAYSGLSYGTSYTVNISGFKDVAGNVMTADSGNSFTTDAAPTYAVTVNGGTGDGSFAAGTTVSITAGTAPAGKEFDKWVVDSANVTLDDENDETTTFTMPAEAVEVTATYKDTPVPTYAVTVNGGTGGGSFAAGVTVSITADPAPAGKVFDKWTAVGVTLANPGDDAVTFTMPANAVTVTATYKNVYAVTYDVTDGTGTAPTESDKAEGDTFAAASSSGIVAPAGKQFKEWNTLADGTGIAYAEGATVTMPDDDLVLYAIWMDVPGVTYTVTYDLNGGSGTAPAESDKGEGVTFAAASSSGITAPAGKQFKEWNTLPDGSGASYATGATVTMPDNDLVLYAIWEDIPLVPHSVTYNANGGSGTVPTETVKTKSSSFIAASASALTAPEGKVFKEWNTMADGSGDGYAPGAPVTMPDDDLVLYAIWDDIPEGSGLNVDMILVIAIVLLIAALAIGRAVSRS